ncbi:MAG: translation initiation factor IF-3 [Helicobacteraceae bacterium]
MSKDRVLLNEDIRFAEVRCVSDAGEQHGIISSREALRLAKEAGLDLVVISADAKPPVVKIMDYGKFKYQQEKKAKEAKKKQKVIDVKELKLTAKTALNDINFKVKHAIEFLEEGKHVRFKVFLKGREMGNANAGVDVLQQIKQMLENYAKIEKDIFRDGRFITMYVVPINEKKKN